MPRRFGRMARRRGDTRRLHRPFGGEAGIGKSSLLQEFSKLQRRARVLWGACDALFTPRPLSPLHDIARQTQGALLAAVSSGANRDEIFTAALDELEKTAALVIFEDMHWADEATLDLLKYLGRRIHRTRAMLAVTYRDDEVGPRHPLRFVLGDLPRASTRRMSLLPLSEPAVARLAKRAGRPSEGLHGVTGGNPFFVTEALAGITGTVPNTVRDAVLSRAAMLSPAAREIAELVSVVPVKQSFGCWSKPPGRMRWTSRAASASEWYVTRPAPLPSGTNLPGAHSKTRFPGHACRVCTPKCLPLW